MVDRDFSIGLLNVYLNVISDYIIKLCIENRKPILNDFTQHLEQSTILCLPQQ